MANMSAQMVMKSRMNHPGNEPFGRFVDEEMDKLAISSKGNGQVVCARR
jgi:hypothetical protein